MTSAVLTLLLTLTLTGCAHYKVISQDRQIVRLQTSKPFTPSIDGWFIPDARWLEIRQAIADKIELLENQNTNGVQKK